MSERHRIPLAIAGVGKIAKDQHIPAVVGGSHFELVAVVDLRPTGTALPRFATVSEMIREMPQVRALSVCTPPNARWMPATSALEAGLDVLVEKPPARTLGEARALRTAAVDNDCVLFAAWHSRAAVAVAPARDWLRTRRIKRVEMIWAEDIRVWHPGQEWIFESGIGVFDPGINGLSILTGILPEPMLLTGADLQYPKARRGPISAQLRYSLTKSGADVDVILEFDRRDRAPQWEISIVCEGGERLLMEDGGARLTLNGEAVLLAKNREYPELYERFAKLVEERRSDVDLSPLIHVVDALATGHRSQIEPFCWKA